MTQPAPIQPAPPAPCTHRPGLVRYPDDRFGADERHATCTDCGVELSSLFDDHDGDGAWQWTRWQPAPLPVVIGWPAVRADAVA